MRCASPAAVGTVSTGLDTDDVGDLPGVGLAVVEAARRQVRVVP
jgi:hypothetical protein